MKRFRIAALGDIIYDHCFGTTSNGLQYINSRGGGPVWNILLNLQVLGHKCFAFGMFGLDNPYGEYAKKELNDFGIDTKYLVGVNNKRSRIIFENLRQNVSEHKFGDRCLVCENRIDETEIVKLKATQFVNEIVKCKPDFLILDRLTKERIELVREVRKILPKLRVVVDIGRIGYLRFVSGSQIISNLCEFDLVFINELEALNPLLKRLKVERGNRKKFISNLLGTKNLKAILSSAGAAGCTLYSKYNAHIEAVQYNPIVDTSGAGDCLLANLIHQMSYPNMATVLESGRLAPLVAKSVKKLKPVLSTVGARGHLKYSKREHPLNAFKGQLITKKRYANEVAECIFCFSKMKKINARREYKPRSKGNEASLSKAVKDLGSKLLFVLERKESIQSCKLLLAQSGNVFVIGTGGSFVSASFIAQVFNEKGNAFAIPIRPFDYINVNTKKTEAIIIISYSGSTADYEPVIKKATELKVNQIVIISHSQKPKLFTYAKSINFFSETHISTISYSSSNSKRERGFLSIAGTLLPCFLFLSASVDNVNELDPYSLIKGKMEKKYDILDQVVDGIKSSHCLEIYGGGFSWSAMLDMESKLIEGNVCAVQLHEYKDFSHGRFMFSLKNRNPKILFQVGTSSYVDKLIDVLKADDVPVLVIKSKFKNLLGSIELLVEVQYLIRKLTDILYEGKGVDISKPKLIPSEGLELYNWKFN